MNGLSVLGDDAVLRRLPDALNEHAMREVFASRMQSFGGRIESCVIERVKYRPLRNCSISYRLTLRDAETGRLCEQRVAARVCGAGEASKRAGRVHRTGLLPSAAGPTFQLVEDLSMLAWWWPNDAKLQAPRLFADGARMRDEVLPEVVAALGAEPGALLDYRLDVVQYVPEDRLCARVELSWAEQKQTLPRVLYVKTSRDPDAGTAFSILRQVHAHAAAGLVTPKPVVYQPRHQLHWQEAVPGCALLDCSLSHRVRLAREVGVRLAALHGSVVGLRRQMDAPALRERLAQTGNVLAMMSGDTAAILADAVRNIESSIDRIAAGPRATLHGDLHARNVLVDGNAVAFIDLDGARSGHPALDIGGWIADAMYHALLEGASPCRDRSIWQGILEGYRSGGGAALDMRTIAWGVAWHLLCQRARRCICNLKPGRPALAPQLIRLASRILQTGELGGE